MSKTRQRVHGLPSCAFSRRARPRERESTFSEAGSSPPNPMPSTWMPSCLGQIVAAQAAPTGYAQVQASWWSHSHISLPSLLTVRNSLTLSSFTFHVRNNCYWMQSSNSTDLLMEMTCPSTLHLPDLGQVQPSTLNQWNQYPLEPWIFFFFLEPTFRSHYNRRDCETQRPDSRSLSLASIKALVIWLFCNPSQRFHLEKRLKL